jgi:hypothetical protein
MIGGLGLASEITEKVGTIIPIGGIVRVFTICAVIVAAVNCAIGAIEGVEEVIKRAAYTVGVRRWV